MHQLYVTVPAHPVTFWLANYTARAARLPALACCLPDQPVGRPADPSVPVRATADPLIACLCRRSLRSQAYRLLERLALSPTGPPHQTDHQHHGASGVVRGLCTRGRTRATSRLTASQHTYGHAPSDVQRGRFRAQAVTPGLGREPRRPRRSRCQLARVSRVHHC